jgi:carboxyl-terminal processing protease
MHKNDSNSGNRIAWGGIALAMVILSAVSISVPKAAAQSLQSGAKDATAYTQLFDQVYQFILKNYVDTVDPKVLYEGAMKGMFESLSDPYSVFLTDKMMGSMNDLTEGVFGGVGLYISKQARDPRLPEDAPRYIEIVSPIEDTPGWKAGLKPGDLISAIDGETTEPMSTDDAMGKIRGKPATTVALHIKRGKALEFDISVARAIIEIPTVRKALIPTDKGPVGYLRIIDFSPQTVPRVQETLKGFKTDGFKALIIDVRSNPGGLLDSVVQISDFFLDKGTIVSTKGRIPYENKVETAKSELSIAKDIPIVVLIDKGTASASEILSGALKDNRRALILGEKSYGKGVVQRIYPIDATGFKLTVSRYYTPSGGSIDKYGITPDIAIKEPDLSEAEAAELQKLISSGAIESWVEANPNASRAQRDSFAAKVLADGIKLPLRVITMIVKERLSRTSVAPAYDLEFDSGLTTALSTLDRPDFKSLIEASATVKETMDKLAASSPGTKK